MHPLDKVALFSHILKARNLHNHCRQSTAFIEQQQMEIKQEML